MKDALVYWLATTEDEIHFIDAVVSAYDGMASVRRDFRMIDGRAMYKIFVSRGMEDEFLDVMKRLRATVAIDDLIREDDATSAAE